MANELGQNFSIGLRKESMAAACQFLAKGGVVFDNAIVNKRQFARTIDVRMRIGITGQSMRGPARVADPERSLNRLFPKQLSETGDAADAFANLQAVVVKGAKAGRVISAILQPAQAIDEQWRRVLFSNVS